MGGRSRFLEADGAVVAESGGEGVELLDCQRSPQLKGEYLGLSYII